MKALSPGTIVRMKVSNAKWMLDHPEIYTYANRWTPKEVEEFEKEAYIHMLCCLGEPVYGVIRPSHADAGTYKVLWAVGRDVKQAIEYFVERKSFDIVREL